MSLLIQLVVVLCLVGLAYWATTALPLPQPVRVIAIVLVSLVGLGWLLNAAGVRFPG